MIVWSEEAKLSYENTIDFILENWEIEIAERFEKITNTLLDQLLINKKLCPESKIKALRKCILHKNTSLIYRVRKNNIELVAFIDNRSEHSF